MPGEAEAQRIRADATTRCFPGFAFGSAQSTRFRSCEFIRARRNMGSAYSIPSPSLCAGRTAHFHLALELELPRDVHAPRPRRVHVLSRGLFGDFELRMPDAHRIGARRQLGDDRFAVLAGLGEVRRIRDVDIADHPVVDVAAEHDDAGLVEYDRLCWNTRIQ